MVISLIGKEQLMNKIILDTDIGDDIDDAFALSILLNEKNADLLGVTTVFRNSYKRAKMASYLIKTFGKDVKVYAGCDEPLIAKVETLLSPEIKAKEKLDENGKYLIPQYSKKMDEGVVEKQHAVDFIIEQVHKYPNEITLVGIGPLTNIALAIRKDPSICSLLKEIRIMGGDPTNVNCKEWNIFCDPEAARIVYEADVPLYAVGLNVTMQVKLLAEYREKLKQVDGKRFSLLSDMMAKWFKHYEFSVPVMHDPLAVTTIFKDVCKFKEDNVFIGLENNERAVTLIDDCGKKIHYAESVDVKEFFEYFLETVFKI